MKFNFLRISYVSTASTSFLLLPPTSLFPVPNSWSLLYCCCMLYSYVYITPWMHLALFICTCVQGWNCLELVSLYRSLFLEVTIDWAPVALHLGEGPWRISHQYWRAHWCRCAGNYIFRQLYCWEFLGGIPWSCLGEMICQQVSWAADSYCLSAPSWVIFFPVLLELELHCRYSMGLGTHDELVVLYILTIREPPNGFYLLQKETALMRGENYTYLWFYKDTYLEHT